MSSALHRRFSVVAILLVPALLAGVLGATPAASGEKGTQWLTQGSDPVGLQEAIGSNPHKLPAEFASRLRYAEDGLLRVIVATTDRTPQVESFVADQTAWAKWYFDNPRFYGAVTPDGLKNLLNSSAIAFVEPDVPLTYFMSSSTLDIHARSLAGDNTGVWSYDAATDSLRSDVAALTPDQATGKGVTVAITDSGIDRTFKDFNGWGCVPAPLQPCNSRIIKAPTVEHIFDAGVEPADALPTTEAASGHGSHVAGTIGGNGFYGRDGGADPAMYGGDGLPFGVAPQANLIMTKNGDAIWAGLSNFGLEWQLAHADEYDIRVSSNSWGCLGGCSFNGSSATGQLFKDMYEAGIVVTFAAGNDGGSDNGAAFSGNAQSPYVLGVAAYNDADHRLASFSSRGSDKTLPDPATWTPQSEPVNGERRPDVAAPGVDIWSARTLTGGAASTVPRVNTTDATGGGGCCIREYAIMSGTSMATPHVAGAAALAFSACPTSTPLDVMRAIMASAETDILKTTGAATAEAWEVGYGGLEVRAAVDWLLARNCDSSNSGSGGTTPDPTPTETATPEPTPTETQAPPPGGKTYYFHSASGIGNIDALEGGSTFDATAPTLTGASTFYDLPGFQSTAAEQIYDPFWSGTVEEQTINRLDVRFWQRAPLGDALAEVHYDVAVYNGGTKYELPTLTKAVPPTIGNATSLIEGTFTTMLDAGGNEVPLAIPGGDVTIAIAGHFGDMEAGAYQQYDSVTKPGGFTVYSGATDPDPTPTETPTETPTSTPTDDPTDPPAPPGRGTYPANPNDPLFADQWGMTTIKAPQAWQETNATGYGIKIAIVDSGLDLGHEDFACPGKLSVLPGSDISVDNTPQDEDGHGTHVAGIAGACTNNGKGVVGVAPDSTIMPVRVFGEPNLDKAMADGIRFATDNGAHVINLSIGDIPPFSHLGALGYPQTEEAMEHARSNGVVIAAAAGNFDQPTCEYPSFSRNVICVVATDRNDVRSYYSDFPVNADPNSDEPKIEPVVAAPGGQGTFCEESITSTYLRSNESICHTSGYEGLDGTSMSSPHVAGIAALMYDRLGGERSRANADRIVQGILDSADDLYTPGWDPIVGYGRVNALEAVRAIEVVEPTPTDPGPAATTLSFTQNSSESGQYTDNARFEAALTDATTGAPIEGAEIIFEITGASGTRSLSAITDAAGLAQTGFKVVEQPDQYVLTARYAGDEEMYTGSADSGTFVVDREDSTTALAAGGKGKNTMVVATLADSDDETMKLAGQTVEFFAEGRSIGTAVTNSEGVASLDVPAKHAKKNTTYSAVFAGDAYFLGSSGTAQT